MTNGIVTICDGDTVLMKAIVGCDGMKAANLVERVKQIQADEGAISLETFHGVCILADFGCETCRVVMDADHILGPSPDEALSPSFRNTFNKPFWNPRWGQGTADYAIALDLKTGEVRVPPSVQPDDNRFDELRKLLLSKEDEL